MTCDTSQTSETSETSKQVGQVRIMINFSCKRHGNFPTIGKRILPKILIAVSTIYEHKAASLTIKMFFSRITFWKIFIITFS